MTLARSPPRNGTGVQQLTGGQLHVNESLPILRNRALESRRYNSRQLVGQASVWRRNMVRTGSSPRQQEATAALGVGAYRPIRFLGRGGMGELYDAEDKATRERVVIKLLREDLLSQPDMIDRMRVEADALHLIHHPNVVRAKARGWTRAGRPFLVMERLRGRTVQEELRIRGALPFLEAVGRTRELLSALAAVHEAGIVHRDVKPDNVFLSCGSEGRVLKLIDFGIARITGLGSARGLVPLSYPTAAGTRIGTPRYAAPEQARGGVADARADIYGAGLILYLLLAGRGPFADVRGAGLLFRAHALMAPDPPSRWARQPIPPVLDAIVLKALAKRPEDRHPDAVTFSRELLQVVVRCREQVDVSPAADGTRIRHSAYGCQGPGSRHSSVVSIAPIAKARDRGWCGEISMLGIVLSAAVFAAMAGALAILLDL